MKEVSIRPLTDDKQAPLTILPAKVVKIQKISSVEAFKKSGIDFWKLKRGIVFDGKILVADINWREWSYIIHYHPSSWVFTLKFKKTTWFYSLPGSHKVQRYRFINYQAPIIKFNVFCCHAFYTMKLHWNREPIFQIESFEYGFSYIIY